MKKLKAPPALAVWLGALLGVAALVFVPIHAKPALAARNSGGTYSPPGGNPVVSGTSISSTWANTLVGDLGTEVTNSLDRNGRGAMLAPLALPGGSSSAPSLAWSSELNTGMYRPSSQNIRFQVNSTTVQGWTATGVTFPLAVSVVGSLIAPTPTIHYVGGGSEPAFQNSWANVSANVKLHFYKTAEGMVVIGGQVNKASGASGAVVFTLPATGGWRPTGLVPFPCGGAYDGVATKTDIYTCFVSVNGDVGFQSAPVSAANSGIALFSIIYHPSAVVAP